MVELILLYYLKNLIKKNKLRIFIYFFLFIILLYLYNIFFKNIVDEEKIIYIEEKSNLKTISKLIAEKTNIQSYILPYSISKIAGYETKLNYGEFLIKKDDNLFNLIKKIKDGNSYKRKITLVEGIEKYQLIEIINSSLLKKDNYNINNYNIIGETFYYYKGQKASSFLKNIDSFSNNFFTNVKIIKDFTINDILIISSLVEKEGKNEYDKKLIYSVIYNRLKKNMKLDIDATVIYSITKGEYKLNRKLNYNDLKIEDAYNTYKNKGLPPGKICIPGLNTIKIVLENHKSPYYYYFFDKNKNSHIFSKNYKEHTYKLKKYRKNG